jgi:hypothetical protein
MYKTEINNAININCYVMQKSLFKTKFELMNEDRFSKTSKKISKETFSFQNTRKNISTGLPKETSDLSTFDKLMIYLTKIHPEYSM